METMLKVSVLRVVAQFSSLICVLALRSVSTEQLGIYAIVISVISIVSAFLTFEGTFLVLSRNYRPSDFAANLLLNRVVWIVLIPVLFYFYEVSEAVFCCALGFIISLDSEYALNTLTAGQRLSGNETAYRRWLFKKIVLAELIVPLLSAMAVVLGLTKPIIFFYVLVILTLNGWLFSVFLRRKKRRTVKAALLPELSGVAMATLKRADSQFFRLSIGWVFGASVLGEFYPALLVGRAGSILGNIWYVFYFKSIAGLRNASLILYRYLPLWYFLVVCAAGFYAIVIQFVVEETLDWYVPFFAYFAFCIINFQFFYKTFMRSISLNERVVSSFNWLLTYLLLSRGICAAVFSSSLIAFLFAAIIIEVAAITLLHHKTLKLTYKDVTSA